MRKTEIFSIGRNPIFSVLLLTLCFSLLALPQWASAQAARRGGAQESLPTISEKTAGFQKIDGYFPLYWDESQGNLWLEISRMNTEVLYSTGLGAGLGSNDIGLDRGSLSGSRIIKFERVGPKILMVQPNYQFRASSNSKAEIKAVRDAFARSVLFGFSAAAESGGNVLVNLTDFLLRDSTGIAQRMSPGTYRLDRSRSSIYLSMTKGFPKNTEMEVELTFTLQPGGAAGGRRGGGGGFFEGVGNVAAARESASLRVHHSLVELPDNNYEPRKYDPRSGYGAVTWQDYSVPLGEPMTQRYIRRHRLQKKDSSAEVSDPVEPIVYYLDPGTPEPMRSALLEGARWWNDAYEALGYRNAFRVELLPEDVSMLDIRYNVINWVHRSTRGWSSGGSVTDPRTGEIIKGVVTLGSLRVRQDYMMAEGLLSPYTNGDETPLEIREWALARIRQLSAHEVGHTIGLGHNYYDSSAGRISVMDYPHPLVTLNSDGTLDYSEVYDVGMGKWDYVTIAYGYQDFPEGTDEDAALAKILDDPWEKDIFYLSNQDTSGNPKVDQWSNGNDPAAELNRMMEIRRVALSRFGETAIKKGQPLALMEEVLVPLYLHHRYQVEAAASALGGMHYIYAMRGDGREPVRPVPASEQNAAMDALMATLNPAELVLPDSILKNLPPRPSGYRSHRELFPRNTGLMFDAITPAMVAADHTVSSILRPDRAARMVEQHALDSSLPGLNAVLTRLISGTFEVATANSYLAEVARTVQRVVIDNLVRLAGSAGMAQVRAIARMHLQRTMAGMTGGTPGDSLVSAHQQLLAADIKRFLESPASPYTMPTIPNAPPGAPIGDPAMEWLRPINKLPR